MSLFVCILLTANNGPPLRTRLPISPTAQQCYHHACGHYLIRIFLSLPGSRLTNDSLSRCNTTLSRVKLTNPYRLQPVKLRGYPPDSAWVWRMSELTRDGIMAEPASRGQILMRERGQEEESHFPCSDDHEQDWQPYRLMFNLL